MFLKRMPPIVPPPKIDGGGGSSSSNNNNNSIMQQQQQQLRYAIAVNNHKFEDGNSTLNEPTGLFLPTNHDNLCLQPRVSTKQHPIYRRKTNNKRQPKLCGKSAAAKRKITRYNELVSLYPHSPARWPARSSLCGPPSACPRPRHSGPPRLAWHRWPVRIVSRLHIAGSVRQRRAKRKERRPNDAGFQTCWHHTKNNTPTYVPTHLKQHVLPHTRHTQGSERQHEPIEKKNAFGPPKIGLCSRPFLRGC